MSASGATLAVAPPVPATEVRTRIGELLALARTPLPMDRRRELIDEVLDLHTALEDGDPRAAKDAEMAFLLLLRDEGEILEEPRYRDFAASCIEQDTFQHITWQSVEEVVLVAEALYGFRFDKVVTADQLTEHGRDLVRHALRQFERRKKHEAMFELFQRAPLPITLMDAELTRLRNRLELHELRRVKRKRHLLYSFLALQTVLILLVFPVIFQNFENGAIQQQVENATGLEIVDGRVQCKDTSEGTECRPPFQTLSLGDSLYWSVVTYSTIGYGDIQPITPAGKFLAGLHGMMGVLTTGILAGLVLNWITPRQL